MIPSDTRRDDMKAPKEYRSWVNWMKKKFGKKNGVVRGFYFDCPRMEIKLENSKRNYSRKQRGIERGL